MAGKVLNGKELATKIKSELKSEVETLKEKGILPGLAVVIVGDDSASRVYVNSKKKSCENIGIESFEYALSEYVSEDELIELIHKLNNDEKVNGILVQLPLPKQINEDRVINSIDPKKDVDAFHPINVGKLMTGNPVFLPCTPAGVMELIKESGIDITGKECVVVGRSNIVGKPMAMLLLAQNGTVTVCHSKTKDIEKKVKNADIVIAAVGKPEFIKGDIIKPGAVVIDVGINRLEGKKLVGDVEFETASGVASAITPVPRGVGPMTIAMLMKNTVKAAILQKEGI
ncbi:bifunctional methylenetetrahydrofolate dehydrogenase/methenyltetrahydrofolate cyclohydrolase FolD [Herbivorax sp. ANBcel31]|uniref:bifunctional methylenetetrahydrofolate dehydrogenase/methenyltetrahydrofolate cyclohydrolase FolD n=1 Tax=Herbivorax sp. ANBcel31 TaxID=3069754 RepID=UPI0027B76C3A|nr:bifunctional methylenetetrahydrofolate dehydrogenase/methenyltetrahydrofolate cyclohydrolase FolD [Herbivorax sp. ANBcel31]MDQ2085959.1 bifunctional methylenetetrahydrofolate dehydrogenase/methenyltetrahydrofolate cyclohydrolase FolD [Herbivorax sp. ANBcel31]